jgi:two-component system cell cycle sensor histidine kinase/response regulator CckA
MSQPGTSKPDGLRAVRAVEDVPREGAPEVTSVARLPHAPAGEPPAAPAGGMEAMGVLAGGIAHVFNNLLTAIGFETELALAHLPADDPARKHLREIERAGERGAAVARQLLAFSGSQVLKPRPLQLNALLRELEDGLRGLLGEGIELQRDLDPDLPWIEADREQLAQVVVNLVTNARDAMPEGGRVTLATSRAELSARDLARPGRPSAASPGPFVRLAVSDTGPGMREEVRRRVFEPFFSTKGGSEPAGLGLSTVYGVVLQSGGQVAVESAPGEGSTFLVYLPAMAGDARGEEEPGAEENWQTILLVEDEENIRRPQAEILAALGYRVLEAADGAQAIALCQRHAGPIHLMVTDILMGGMDGVELAERMAFLRPEMKVLFASGYPVSLAEHPGRAVADAPLLKKPFTGRALATKVREVLESEG